VTFTQQATPLLKRCQEDKAKCSSTILISLTMALQRPTHSWLSFNFQMQQFLKLLQKWKVALAKNWETVPHRLQPKTATVKAYHIMGLYNRKYCRDCKLTAVRIVAMMKLKWAWVALLIKVRKYVAINKLCTFVTFSYREHWQVGVLYRMQKLLWKCHNEASNPL